MKQRITVEQLNELSEEQKERLREWWKPEKYNDCEVVYDGKRSGVMEYWTLDDEFSYGPHFTKKSECLPLLSIGQMIELTRSESIIKYHGGWALEEGADAYHEELCDALWEDVKRYL